MRKTIIIKDKTGKVIIKVKDNQLPLRLDVQERGLKVAETRKLKMNGKNGLYTN